MKTRFIEITLEEMIERSGFVFIVKKSDTSTTAVDVACGDKKYIPPFRKTKYHFEIIEELYPKSSVALVDKKLDVLESFYNDKLKFYTMYSAGYTNKIPVYDRYKIYSKEIDLLKTRIVFLRFHAREHCFQFVVEGAHEDLAEKDRVIKLVRTKLEKQDEHVKTRIKNANLHINSLYYMKNIESIKDIPLPDEWYRDDKKETVPWWKRILKKVFSKKVIVKSKEEILKELSEKYKDVDIFRHTVQFNRQDECDKCAYKETAYATTVVSLKNNTSAVISVRDLHDILEHQGKFTEHQYELLKRCG